jgi:two-component system alkaline phosphatase synthesis response regulator PhoP
MFCCIGVASENIDVVPDGQAACEQFTQSLQSDVKGQYDIIYLDLHMPRKNGFDTAREIRKQDEHIPIIALTANSSELARMECVEARFSHFISKPFTMNQIRSSLSKYLGIHDI